MTTSVRASSLNRQNPFSIRICIGVRHSAVVDRWRSDPRVHRGLVQPAPAPLGSRRARLCATVRESSASRLRLTHHRGPL